jgi:hypothetical protein
VASSTPTAKPSASAPAEGDVYATIAAQVERIRGLKPTGDVTPVVIDEATLRKNLAADFDRENPPDQVAASERTLKALGLLEPDASLRDLILDLQGGQVIGYYSPEQDELFVVSRAGGIGATQKATYAHEYTHQLQDQNFDLESLGIDASEQGDRSTARLALVEGDAVTTQTGWMQGNLSAEELQQILAEANGAASLEAFQKAPAILRETLLFPYQQGALFVTNLTTTGGFRAIDAAFTSPPESTEQIIHPEKYRNREAPIPVALPADLPAKVGAGWSDGGQDTLGELAMLVWLSEGGVSTDLLDAAAGWGGDRLMLLDTAGGSAIAWVTEWDSAADAIAFAAAATTAIDGLKLTAQVRGPGSGRRVDIAIAPDAPTVSSILAALGG